MPKWDPCCENWPGHSMRINDRKGLIISAHNDLCVYSFCCIVFASTCSLCFFYVRAHSERLYALDNDIYELCMWCHAFHSISALIFPQTTLQRQVSGHLVVNKLKLIDFNSGQHPSAKLSPGSELNKLPPGTVLRSALVYYVWQFRAQASLRKTDLNSALLVQLFKNKRSKCILNKLLNTSKCIQQNVLYPMQINKSFNCVKVDLCPLGFYSYRPINTSAGVS